jgi:hypothetical protein
VLVGPQGKLKHKNLTSNQLVSNFLNEATAMKGLLGRIDQFLYLQEAAVAPDVAAASSGCVGGPPSESVVSADPPDSGDNEAAAPEMDNGSKTFTFKPGMLGIDADWSKGLVKSLIEGSQADLLGVPVGWYFCIIEDQPFNVDLLDHYLAGGNMTGTCEFRITFSETPPVPLAQQPPPPPPPRVVTWEGEIGEMREKWLRGDVDVTGLAEPFRGSTRVKWQVGLLEKAAMASDFPSLILDVPRNLAELLLCHIEVMGPVHGMTSEGGSKEALAAIYALRQRDAVTGRLLTTMDRFITSARLVHNIFKRQHLLGLEKGQVIKGQTPTMQRMYFESYSACNSLRESILNEWHQLWLKLSDRDLAEEAQRIDMSGKEAFGRLMGLSTPLAILGPSASSQPLSLQDGSGYLGRQSSPRALQLGSVVDIGQVVSDDENVFT